MYPRLLPPLPHPQPPPSPATAAVTMSASSPAAVTATASSPAAAEPLPLLPRRLLLLPHPDAIVQERNETLPVLLLLLQQHGLLDLLPGDGHGAVGLLPDELLHLLGLGLVEAQVPLCGATVVVHVQARDVHVGGDDKDGGDCLADGLTVAGGGREAREAKDAALLPFRLDGLKVDFFDGLASSANSPLVHVQTSDTKDFRVRRVNVPDGQMGEKGT